MNILITGTSGYIGSHVQATLQQINGICTEGLPCRLHDLKPGMLQPDMVIHSAGALRSRPNELFSSNTDGMSYLLASLSRKTPVIYLSSKSVYGTKRTGIVEENDPVAPDDDYGLSKWQAEKMLKDSGNPYVILRLTGVIGAGVRSVGYCFPCKAIKRFHEGASADLVREDEPHQYVCIDDVVSVIQRLLSDRHGWNDTYHVAGEKRSLHKLIYSMRDACDQGDIRLIDNASPSQMTLSNTKTDALMGSDSWRTPDHILIEKALQFLNIQSTG
jgi:nucleoside-diphosphate-sugar epimerase